MHIMGPVRRTWNGLLDDDVEWIGVRRDCWHRCFARDIQRFVSPAQATPTAAPANPLSPRAEIFLPAQKTKTKRDRRIPISSVLRLVLEARRSDPVGAELPAERLRFSATRSAGRRRSIKTAFRLIVGGPP